MSYIERDVTLNIDGKTAKFDDMVYIFKGDRDIQLNIKIIDTKMKFSRTNISGNVLTPLPKGCYARVGLVKPKGGDPVIRDRVAIEDDKVKFLIDSTVCDELDEVGIHKIQIQIYALDDDASPRWTLPSAAELEVCKPDVDFDGITPIVGSAKAGLSMTISEGDTTIVDFNPDGTYNKTIWSSGDVISTEKLNKIENVLDHNVNKLNEHDTQIKDIANIGISEKLQNKFDSTSLEDILLEIYNKIYTPKETIANPWSDTTGMNIPEINFAATNWSEMTKENSIDTEISYLSDSINWKGVANTKWQGNSSLVYDKKNFTIKLYEDKTKTVKQKANFNNWGGQNKFVLKANYIDHSHSRNVISARIWSEIVESRSDYSSLPEELRTSPNNGAIDGFPVKVTINGVYQGLYTLNIPKDTWTFNIDDENSNHAVLCAELNNNGNMSNDRILACEFRGYANIDGTDWSLEIPDALNDDIKVSFNNLINCVKDSTDNQFKYNIGNYLDVKSAIDYYIFQYFICGLDSLAKNLLMVTYDGIKWLCSAYDMDSTFGLYYDGSKFVSNNYQCPEQYQETNSLLWQRLETIFANDIKSRYAELRESVLSVENIISKFTSFMNIIGDQLYAKDLEVYNSIPQGSVNHLQQISDFITDRATYVDAEISNLVQTEIDDEKPVSSVTINNTLSLSIPNGIEMIDYNKNGVNLDKEIYNATEATKVGSIVTNPVDIDLENYYNFMTSCQSDVTKTPRVGECNADGSLSFTYKIAENTALTTCLIGKTKVRICETDTDKNNFVDSVKLFRINKNTLENSITQEVDSSYIINPDGSGDVFTSAVENLNYGDILVMKCEQAVWNGCLLYKSDGSYDVVENSNTTNLKFIRNAGQYTSFGFKVKKSMYDEGYKMKYMIIKASQLNDLAELTATITPLDATNQEVTWTSSDENVVIIEGSGLSVNIKALKIGNANITCTSQDTANGTISDTCSVTVSSIN